MACLSVLVSLKKTVSQNNLFFKHIINKLSTYYLNFARVGDFHRQGI